MSLNPSATRTSSIPAMPLKNLLARINIALDKTQRQRAAEMIQRYRHLIAENDEKA